MCILTHNITIVKDNSHNQGTLHYIYDMLHTTQHSTIQYILVMLCFLVGYRVICHASLLFSVYTRTFTRVSIRRKYKWQVKRSEISANFRKLGKRFKAVFEELKRFMKLLKNFRNSSKVFSRCFYDFLKYSERVKKFQSIFCYESHLVIRSYYGLFSI